MSAGIATFTWGYQNGVYKAADSGDLFSLTVRNS